MKAQVLTEFARSGNMSWMMCFGLLLFVAVFLGACFWVYRAGSREFYGRMELLPLEDGK